MNDGTYQKLRLVYQKPEVKASTEVILSVFASLFLVVMAVRPTLITVTELKKKIEDQTLVETRLNTKIKRLIQAKKQLDENKATLPLFERAVPEVFAYGDLAKKIELVALEERVEIESLSFSSAVVSIEDGSEQDPKKKRKKGQSLKEWVDGNNKVKEFTVSFSLVANEPAMVNFIRRIENLDRVITISAIEITKVKEKAIPQNNLRANGVMNGYYLTMNNK